MGNAVYNALWYMSDVKTIKSLLIIMLRCRKPMSLAAIPTGVLNYELFVLVRIIEITCF